VGSTKPTSPARDGPPIPLLWSFSMYVKSGGEGERASSALMSRKESRRRIAVEEEEVDGEKSKFSEIDAATSYYCLD
jgi:hypothetical protein